MLVKLRYVGVGKRSINWNSMGKAYSFTLVPGKEIVLEKTQAKIAQNYARFEVVKDGTGAVPRPKPKPVGQVEKLDPFKEEVVEEEVVEEVEEPVEDDTEVGLAVVEEEEEDGDPDFAAMTKQQICDWLMVNGHYEVKKSEHKKDDLIYLAMEHYKSL